MKLEWLRNKGKNRRKVVLICKHRKHKMSKLEANICRLTILHFSLESLFLRVGGHGDFKINENNNEKLSHISIVDHILFDTHICSCGLEST